MLQVRSVAYGLTMRHAARVDTNQAEIIAALQAAGAGVEVIRQPLDLLVSYARKWALIEVKANPGQARAKTRTRQRQLAFAERHPHGGIIATIWDVEGAIRVLRCMSGEQ